MLIIVPMKWKLVIATLGGAVALASCSGQKSDRDAGPAGSSGSSSGSPDDGGTGGSTDDGQSGDGGGGDDGSGDPLFDVGGGDGSGGDGDTPEGCKKVDFLFVIDNSGSMGDNQTNLVNSFPGFMSSIQNTLTEAQDYHVMVVDTDAEWGGDCPILCNAFMGVCPDIPEYPCDAGPPTECETTLGAGVTYPMGSEATNMWCSFSSGRRYMDTTEPDLSAAFQCAAKVGTDGDSGERPIEAMVAALSDQLAQPNACNEGFVRSDAILVITIITDEEDSDSVGTPEGWHANIVASKAGDETAIVMLGLINDTDAAAPICPAESQDPVKVRTFVDMFPNSIRGSVCEPSYNAFFQEAVDLIDTACDEFDPPG